MSSGLVSCVKNDGGIFAIVSMSSSEELNKFPTLGVPSCRFLVDEAHETTFSDDDVGYAQVARGEDDFVGRREKVLKHFSVNLGCRGNGVAQQKLIKVGFFEKKGAAVHIATAVDRSTESI